jgi:methylene-tetrahydromethanopterin dehydrogenase
MERPYLLHLLTPAHHASPFDVNMAYDAGWDAVTTYTEVDVDEVESMIQDVIFSRGPKGARRSGVFIGGRSMQTAMDMSENAWEAMMPPFAVSVFADPSGAFTTAAAMVAKVEQQLKACHGQSLEGQRVVVLGGTGPVGSAAAVLAARCGAQVVVMGRRQDRADRVAALCSHSFGAELTGIRGDVNEHKAEQLAKADIVLGTAKAGVQVMNGELVASAERLKVAADLNAVPPAGIKGLGLQDDGTPLAGSRDGAVGIGALAIGGVKYEAQHQLLVRMRLSDEPLHLHFEHAFELARELVGQEQGK